MRRGLLGAFLLVSALAFTAHAHADDVRPRGPVPPAPIDGIAAIVDDVTIYRSDVALRIKRLESTLSRDPSERRKQLAELARGMVGRLVDETLITKDAAALKLEVESSEVGTAIDTVAAANKMDRKRLEAEVLLAGFSPAEYKEEIRRQILEQKWLVSRAMHQIDRRKLSDPAALEEAVERQRRILLSELRSRAYIEIR